jgi:hypothetical protein
MKHFFIQVTVRSTTLRLSVVLGLLAAILVSVPPLRGQERPASKPTTSSPVPKIRASAVRVEMTESDEIKLPAEFQVALYENLIQQLEKKGDPWHVYRNGDRRAANLPGLVVLHSTVRGFKEGSEMKREVTTVTGATSITVHCQFTDSQGKVLLERDIDGKVRFFGANLKATYDFAKKAATFAHESLSAADGI